MSLPVDYIERVYAGVLGKIIGVYLGRPFEGWSYERIMAELGEVNYYVNEKLNVPLIVTDDDIAGTFTFLRALPDHCNQPHITPAQIGQTWLNYLIDKRTVLWWGGLGNSTEHTAYLRLRNGISAPQSGSIATNGVIAAEQIGAQIFIDGWAMVAPGDPGLAAELARKASSVSHDGEAIYGAQMLAAMEAQAFVEPDLNTLIETGLRFVPRNSTIYRLVNDLREWRAAEPDWRKTFQKIVETYGYSNYPGNCHLVPNHALIHLALLYGDDDFQKSLMIVNTCGWDTDCNSGNVGCLLGIKNGLNDIDSGVDWRGPVADRLYLPTADGGRAITDAVRETFAVVNIGRALAGQAPISPKNGARFHFELPGAVQGFQSTDVAEAGGTITLANVAGHSQRGSRSLALHFQNLTLDKPVRAQTFTFIPAVNLNLRSYDLIASPTLYPGQVVDSEVELDANTPNGLTAGLFIKYYGIRDTHQVLTGSMEHLMPGERKRLSWKIPDLGGLPILSIGIEIRGREAVTGTLYLDYLTWHGTPKLKLSRPGIENTFWQRAWVDAVDLWDVKRSDSFRLVQNECVGVFAQGTREWGDYQVSARVRSTLATSFGLGARVQGLRRYYALLLCKDNKARLVKALDTSRILLEVKFPLQFNVNYDLTLKVQGQRLQGLINGDLLFDYTDDETSLDGGAAALIIEEGVLFCDAVMIS